MISITVFSWSVLFCGSLCCQLVLCVVFRLIFVKEEVHVLGVCYFIYNYFLVFARAMVRLVVVWYTVHYCCSTSDKSVDFFLTWLGIIFSNHYYLVFGKVVVDIADVCQKSRPLLDLVGYIVHHYSTIITVVGV